MHHHRRKSSNTSYTDVRKAVTATDLSKKSTSRSSAKIEKLGKNPRDREREWEEERWWEDERESFPHYCMFCETAFEPEGDQTLYCSLKCRMNDQNSASAVPNRYSTSQQDQYPVYSAPPEPRDIIPRASPSRPTSTLMSPPTTPADVPSAISALKSLSIRPASPASPVGTYQSTLWPFGGRSVTTSSPKNSYTKTTPGVFSSTYDCTYYTATDCYGTSHERPLPSRRPPTYSRPKSIELVTPMLGR